MPRLNVPIDDLHTLREWISWASNAFSESDLFYGHGTDNAYDDAFELVVATAHLDRDIPDSYLEAKLSAPEKETLVRRIDDRITRRLPVPYITGRAYFAGLEFKVNNAVLVPRSPFAELAVKQFQPWVGSMQVKSVLDLCTGSGCIGIACAYAFPKAIVDLADISLDALNVAQENIKKHDLVGRVKEFSSDVFSGLGRKKYDLIVSNPPYVSSKEMEDLPVEYWHEPELGLEAGEDGMDIVKVILKQASKHLTPNGIIIVEVGASADLLMARYPMIPFLWIDFEYGGDGVFMLTNEQLKTYQDSF